MTHQRGLDTHDSPWASTKIQLSFAPLDVRFHPLATRYLDLSERRSPVHILPSLTSLWTNQSFTRPWLITSCYVIRSRACKLLTDVIHRVGPEYLSCYVDWQFPLLITRLYYYLPIPESVTFIVTLYKSCRLMRSAVSSSSRDLI